VTISGARLVGLRKAYAGRQPAAVDGLDLELPPGGLTALLGPSGCGKTTTLKMVAGLVTPDAGDVRLDGRSIVSLPPEKRPVAMVFQKPLLFPHLSAGDNVAFGLRMRRVPLSARRSRVADMLDLVQLPQLGGRRVDELSGGQEQRVSLARALVTDPQLLLLDEPFSQLDAGLRAEMRALVRHVQRDTGVTTLFVTHDQQEAIDLADRVALMFDGRVEQHDEPRAFYERLTSLRVAAFFGGHNVVPGRTVSGRFACALGQLTVPAETPDGAGLLVIRPESLQLVDGGGLPPPNTFTAQVMEARYLGTHVTLTLDAGGAQLHLTATPTSTVASGDRVRVRIPARACIVFPADCPAAPAPPI